MFSTLMTAHLLYAFAVRQPTGGRRPSRNRWLAAAVVGGLALQVLVVQLPLLQPIMGTAGLTGREWGLVVTAGALPAVVMMSVRSARRRIPKGEPWTS
jgi:Cation transporting ATPase, C-terminus